jgi:DNA mismatch endonuclease, patch repair protein
MSRIRGKDTTPEKVVRALLHRMGYRYRLHVRIPVEMRSAERGMRNESTKRPARLSTLDSLARRSAAKTARPSTPRFVTPDFVLTKQRIAIFVHGCFWHRHRGCKNCTTPTHRRDWWLKKLNGNVARDKLHQRALRQLGWRPMVIWECQTEKLEKLARLQTRLERTLSAARERKERKARGKLTADNADGRGF